MLFVACEAIATVHMVFQQGPRRQCKNLFHSPPSSSTLLYSANRRDADVGGSNREIEKGPRGGRERGRSREAEREARRAWKKMEEGIDERKYHVFMAKLAEKAERYDELVESMKKVARLDVELTPEERNLLSVGYKNVIGARRGSWLILSSLEKQEEAKGSQGSKQHVIWMRKYRKDIEDEISKLCNDALSVIAIHLLPSSATGESLVHYYKLKGDCYRYLAEIRTGNERQEAADQSLRAYQAATSTAVMDLPSSHPIRLSLALNFSVFYYEIMGSTERACQLAQQAFDEAVTEITVQGEDSNRDSIPILQLIQENVTLWTSDPLEQGGEQSKDIGIEMQG